jgi:hypothetical protein
MDDTDVHVIAGPSAAACLQEGVALRSDQLLIHNDLLSCGPLPPLVSFDEWRDRRQAYLRSLDTEGWSFAFDEDDRDLLTHRERLRGAQTITLWLGTGLAEQLMLLWVVALLRHLAIDPGRCRVVQFNLDRNHEVVAVGVLNPSRFREQPQPTRLDEPAIQEATRAWNAVTAPEPDALLALLTDQDHSLPFLRPALSSLLFHYPDLVTGLNAWEYQLLYYVREVGPKGTRVVGYTMAHDMDFPEWMADNYLFDRLRRLGDSALPRPLVTLSGDKTSLRGTEVRLTPHGEAVLAGKGNAVAWNGIDDWVAGVHLDSRNSRVWFRKDLTVVLREAGIR